MDLDALRLFAAVAERRSFSRAASELGLHRSAVSRRVAALEQSLGVELLIRTTRRVEPTTAGRRLLADVAPLLEQLEAAVLALPESGGAPAGPLRISAPPDVGMWLLPAALGELAEAHPAVRPSVHLSNRVVDLEREGFDVALRIVLGRRSDSRLRARRIGTIRSGLYAAPTYLARRGAPETLDQVAEHTLVGLSGMVPDGLDAETVVSAGDMLLAAELAKRGVGVAFLPTFLADEAVAAGALVRLLGGDEPRAEAGLYLVFPGGDRLPAKSEAFRDAVLRFTAAHPLE